MGGSRVSLRTVIGVVGSPIRQGLSLRPGEMLPNARFRPGKASRSHDPIPTRRGTPLGTLPFACIHLPVS